MSAESVTRLNFRKINFLSRYIWLRQHSVVTKEETLSRITKDVILFAKKENDARDSGSTKNKKNKQGNHDIGKRHVGITFGVVFGSAFIQLISHRSMCLMLI